MATYLPLHLARRLDERKCLELFEACDIQLTHLRTHVV